jgi:serine phosphatase RsbU (regulator of sigma subunit)/Tfp pilus assembly protein PilF
MGNIPMNKKHILLILFCFTKIIFSQNIDSLKQQLEVLPDGGEKVNTYLELINSYNLSSLDEVLHYVNDGIELSKKLQLVELEGKINVNAGSACYYYDQPLKAKSYFERAIFLSSSVNDKQTLARAFNNIGIIYDTEGDFKKALLYYKKSFKLKIEIGESKSARSTIMNIGGVYFMQGYYHKALKSFLESEKIGRELNDEMGVAHCIMNTYIVYEKMGRSEDAVNKIREAIPLLRSSKQEKYLSGIYQKIATSKISLGEIDSAEYYINTGLQIAQLNHDSIQISFLYNSRASILVKRNRYEEALSWALKAKDIREAKKDVVNYPEVYAFLAELYLELNNINESEKYISKSINSAKNNGQREPLIRAYQSASKVYKAKKDYAKALDYYIKYDELQDSIKGKGIIEKVNQLELQNEREKQHAIVKLLEKEKELKEMQLKKNQYTIWSVSAGLLVVLFFLFIVFKNYKQKQKANIEISYQKDIIEEKNKDITDSINYASRIQNTILPDSKIFDTYFSDSFIFYHPKDIVSGDFYFAEEKNDKVYFAVVDCTGHGVPGALVSVFGYNGLRRCINEYNLSNPAEILDKLSTIVQESFKTEGKEVADGMDLSLCVYDKKTQIVEYAGANNPLWVHQNEDIVQIKGDKQPVGHYHNRKPFTNHLINLNAGDSLYLFSDGFADQFGGEKGKKFKYSQFRQMVLDNVSKPMSEQKIIIGQAFEKWKGNLEQVDDICILGIRI